MTRTATECVTPDGLAAYQALVHLSFRHADEVSEDSLGDLHEVADAAARAIRYQVEALRNREPSTSWRAIGQALGISAQAAQQKYTRA
jgi:hypothetical protein